MTINKTQENGKINLAIVGKLNTGTSPQFQETLITAFDGANEVVLDFSELAYLSSAGLRVLVLGEQKAEATGKTMTITNVSPDVMEVFDITGLTDVLKIR